MTRRLLAAAVAAACLVGCGPTAPDYQSIWTTSSSTTATSAPQAAELTPFPDYLDNLGVSGRQVAPDSLTDLTVSIPTPPGWAKSTNRNYSPETLAIAKGDDYPIAIVVVLKLDGDFDAAEAVKHGNTDAHLNENFTELGASTADFHGFPSTMIEGSYDHLGTRLHSYNRIVIATGSGPAHQRYLVQLTVTTLAEETVAQADDIEAIIRGFTVAAR